MLEERESRDRILNEPEVSTRSNGLWCALRFGVKNGSELFSEDRLAVKPMDWMLLALYR